MQEKDDRLTGQQGKPDTIFSGGCERTNLF